MDFKKGKYYFGIEERYRYIIKVSEVIEDGKIYVNAFYTSDNYKDTDAGFFDYIENLKAHKITNKVYKKIKRLWGF